MIIDERNNEQLREFFIGFKDGKEYSGNVIVSIWCKNPRIVMRTELVNPSVDWTSLGIMMTDCNDRVDVNFRGVSNFVREGEEYVEVDYNNVKMAILLMPD